MKRDNKLDLAIGIDPGETASIAYYYNDSLIGTYNLPYNKIGTDILHGEFLKRANHQNKTAVLLEGQFFGKRTVSASMDSLLRHERIIKKTFTDRGYYVLIVEPKIWRWFAPWDPKDLTDRYPYYPKITWKKMAINAYNRLYPQEPLQDDNLAEAALMAITAYYRINAIYNTVNNINHYRINDLSWDIPKIRSEYVDYVTGKRL